MDAPRVAVVSVLAVLLFGCRVAVACIGRDGHERTRPEDELGAEGCVSAMCSADDFSQRWPCPDGG
jgi:hypothetical protein